VPPARVFADAAPDPRFPGSFLIGLWSDRGPTFRKAPVWVDTQQAAELYGALVAIDEFRHLPSPHIQLGLDNCAALSQLVCGRARPHLASQHRILRRLAHKLRWTGALVDLYYVESLLNPADPVSRPFSYSTAQDIVVHARARLNLYLCQSSRLCWGQLADRDRFVH
jgi:hypothetical protein